MSRTRRSVPHFTHKVNNNTKTFVGIYDEQPNVTKYDRKFDKVLQGLDGALRGTASISSKVDYVERKDYPENGSSREIRRITHKRFRSHWKNKLRTNLNELLEN